MAKAQPTAARVRELFFYDAETGVFTRIVPISERDPAGKVAGSLQTQGYQQIRVDGGRYLAHRLAWLYVHGEWPKGVIDHINGIPLDNRIANLREADIQINAQNLHKARSDSLTGIQGITKVWNRWRAQIHIDGSSRYLGSFATPEEAHAAYVAAKREIHPGCTL